MERMFNEADDDNSLYDWKSEEDRKEEVAKMGYPMWKSLQARAGKTLLKLHKPETTPIPGFDSLELRE